MDVITIDYIWLYCGNDIELVFNQDCSIDNTSTSQWYND